MRAHIIENGKIINTIEVDSLDAIPGLALVDADAGGRIGDEWDNGAPVPPAPPAPDPALMVDYMNEVRDLRERLLNRLAGICAAAIVNGDMATQQAFVTARQRLLDITKVPAVVAAYHAGNLVALQAAVKAEYAAVVSTSPPSLVKAFNEVQS